MFPPLAGGDVVRHKKALLLRGKEIVNSSMDRRNIGGTLNAKEGRHH